MLAGIIKDQARPQVVKVSTKFRDFVAEHLVRENKDPVPSEKTCFRASGLGRFCPRMYGLAMRDGFSLGEEFDAESLWRFAVGTGYHVAFQDEILPNLKGKASEVFQGWWKCEHCATVHKGMEREGPLSHGWIPKPNECMYSNCPSNLEEDVKPAFKYEELEFEFDEFRLTGHSDIIYVWGLVFDGEEDELIDLKSINGFGFDYVNPTIGGRAKPDHVLQVRTYMMLAGLKKGRIVYIDKTAKTFAEAIAEHVVLHDDDTVHEIKTGLQTAMEALRDGTVPERLPECTKLSAKRTKYCPARKPCFAK